MFTDACKIKVTLSFTRGYGDRASVLSSDVRLANYSTSGDVGVNVNPHPGTRWGLVGKRRGFEGNRTPRGWGIG